jgi:gas vesicle protein
MRQYDNEDEPLLVIEKRSGGVGSFLLGIAVGAGIALLMAPQSGVETRQQIRRRARRASNAVRETAMETYEQARTTVGGRIDSARQALELKKQQVTRAMEAGRAAAQQARDDLERRIAETKAAYRAGVDVARHDSHLDAPDEARSVVEQSDRAGDDDGAEY